MIEKAIDEVEDFDYDKVGKLTEEDLKLLGIHLSVTVDADLEQETEMSEGTLAETENATEEEIEEKIEVPDRE